MSQFSMKPISDRIGKPEWENHIRAWEKSGHSKAKYCRRNILKILYWDSNGFALWYKRLEKSVFRWPKDVSEVLEIGNRELFCLLQGMDIHQPIAHKAEKYNLIYRACEGVGRKAYSPKICL